MFKQWRQVGGCLAVILLSAGTAPAQFLPEFEIFRPRAPRQTPEAEARERLRIDARAAYEQGDYEKTVALTSQVIAAEPNHPVAYYYRASARIELGKIADSDKLVREGISDAREALRIGGNLSHILYIPYLYGLTTLTELERRPEHAELAIKTITPVLKNPAVSRADLTALYYQRALAQMARQDFRAAAADYAEAIRLNPNFQGAYFGHAHAQALAGEVFPRSPLVYNERGSFLLGQGDSETAVRDFTRAVQLDPQFAMGFTNRGFALSHQQAWKQAEADYRQALQLEPEQPVFHRLLANCEVAQGKAKAALTDFAQAVTLAPQDAQTYADRGCARFFLDDFAGAAADFDKSLQLNPLLTDVGPWRYQAGVRQGRAEPAKTQLQAWIKASQGPRGWTLLLVNYLLGEATDEQLLAGVDEKNPRMKTLQLCEAHFFIGQKLAAAGQADQAATHFKECLKTGAAQHATFQGARYALQDFSGK
jgi:tetratricopeptide (TPR) repeat protein